MSVRVTAMFVVVLLLRLFVYPDAAFAFGNTNCQTGGGGPPSFWRGQTFSDEFHGAKHGASAVVEGYAMQRCKEPGFPIEIDGSFYFTNIVPDNGTFNDIIQVGYGRARCPIYCPDGEGTYYAFGRNHATQGCAGYSDLSPQVHYTGSGNGGSGTHAYKVYHTANAWKLYVDTTVVATYPESDVCWTGRHAIWFGETWDIGDQLGGDVSNHISVWNTYYANSEGGSWYSTAFNPAAACTYAEGSGTLAYHCDATGSERFEIWTDNR